MRSRVTTAGNAPSEPADRRAVCITRHGDRLDFADPRWQYTTSRPYDPPLSPVGVIQSRELGQRLLGEQIEHIFCSPFLRSAQTAHEIAEILGLGIHVEPGLSEWLSAAWFPAPPQLEPLETLCRRFPRIDPGYVPRVPATYGESGEAALERAAKVAARLVTEFRGNLLFVGHGASVLGSTAGLLRQPPAQAEQLLQPIRCCCLIKLVRTGDSWELDLNGDVAHLSHTEASIRFQ
jgi:broad specificity phosphatase PhoE